MLQCRDATSGSLLELSEATQRHEGSMEGSTTVRGRCNRQSLSCSVAVVLLSLLSLNLELQPAQADTPLGQTVVHQ